MKIEQLLKLIRGRRTIKNLTVELYFYLVIKMNQLIGSKIMYTIKRFLKTLTDSMFLIVIPSAIEMRSCSLLKMGAISEATWHFSSNF